MGIHGHPCFNPWFNGLSFLNQSQNYFCYLLQKSFNPWFNGLSFLNKSLIGMGTIGRKVSILGLMDYLFSIAQTIGTTTVTVKFQSLV